LANKYLNDTAPFRRVKTDPERAGSTLHQVLRALHVAAEWLAPALPETMCELKRRIGVVDGVLSPGNPVHKGMPLFPKYEFQAKDETSAVTSPEKTSKAKAPAPTTETEWVSFEDFSRLDLRVGTVLQAEPVEGASKLLKLSVDLGTETRQVVAGLAKSYSAEELQGSQVVVVANLKPRTIFGLESQGMVLAARKRKKLIIVTPQTEIKAGAEVS
jgi:methionyl-tRNA synthetase